jgi:hypothetical protein
MAQVVEHIPSKHETMIQTPALKKKIFFLFYKGKTAIRMEAHLMRLWV